MKSKLVSAIKMILAVAFAGATPAAAQEEPKGSVEPNEIYVDLRNLALEVDAAQIGLEQSGSKVPLGIVMDMPRGRATATMVAFASGDASLYFSTGGGIIGAGAASPEVAAAARQFVATAESHLEAMELVSDYPLPAEGEMTFYVTTPAGVFGTARPEQALVEGNDPFSPLFYAGQVLLTMIRLAQQ